MAIVATTLSSPITRDALTIRVALAAGAAIENVIRIDDEFYTQTAAAASTTPTVLPVRGGEQGSRRVAHNAGTQVLMGLPGDFPNSPTSTGTPVPVAKTTRTVTYAAAGAIAIPTTLEGLFVELITGTAGAMTIAAPTLAIEGAEVNIMAKDAQAYTVAGAFNLGGGSSDLLTFNGTAGSFVRLRAENLLWQTIILQGVTIS